MRALIPIVLLASGCNVMEPDLVPEHACENVSVAGTALDAAASPADAGDAVIESMGEPYTVTLIDGAPGYVRIEVPEATGAVLFVGDEGVVRSLSYCDFAIPLPDPAPNGYCAEDIPEHYHLDLVPGFYHLELGPAPPGSVWLMLSDLAEAHVHEH